MNSEPLYEKPDVQALIEVRRLAAQTGAYADHDSQEIIDSKNSLNVFFKDAVYRSGKTPSFVFMKSNFVENLNAIPVSDINIETAVKFYTFGVSDHVARTTKLSISQSELWAQTMIDDLYPLARLKIIKNRLEASNQNKWLDPLGEPADGESESFLVILQRLAQQPAAQLVLRNKVDFYKYRFDPLDKNYQIGLLSVLIDRTDYKRKWFNYQQAIVLEEFFLDRFADPRSLEELERQESLNQIIQNTKVRLWKERQFFNKLAVDYLAYLDSEGRPGDNLEKVEKIKSQAYIQARVDFGLPIELDLQLSDLQNNKIKQIRKSNSFLNRLARKFRR